MQLVTPNWKQLFQYTLSNNLVVKLAMYFDLSHYLMVKLAKYIDPLFDGEISKVY